jgi:hypothetical protein
MIHPKNKKEAYVSINLYDFLYQDLYDLQNFQGLFI